MKEISLNLDAKCKEVDNKRDKLVENGMQKHIEKYGGARLLLAWVIIEVL